MSLEQRIDRLEKVAHVGADSPVDPGKVRDGLAADIDLLATWPAAEPTDPPVPTGDARLDAQRLAVWKDAHDLEAMVEERRRQNAQEAHSGTIPPDGQSIDPPAERGTA
jgi:hypothetical protein